MINYWAVVVAAISAMVIGSIWWGPLFGKMWNEANGFDKFTPEQREQMKKKMGLMYTQQAITSLIQAWVLALVLDRLGHHDLTGGITYALLLWLGFIFTTQYGEKIWSSKSKKFTLAVLGSSLVTMLAMGLIIGAW